jgi:hypothetical protein
MEPVAPLEFTIDGEVYRAEKLTAFAQFHVSRRIAPLIPTLIPVFMQIAQSEGNTLAILSKPELLQPFADSLAHLPDDSAEYVLNTCLSVVRRKSGDHWPAIWNASSKRAMVPGLDDLSALMPIVLRVIQDSLGSFISGLATSPPVPKGNPA